MESKIHLQFRTRRDSSHSHQLWIRKDAGENSHETQDGVFRSAASEANVLSRASITIHINTILAFVRIICLKCINCLFRSFG